VAGLVMAVVAIVAAVVASIASHKSVKLQRNVRRPGAPAVRSP
jgi:hypothetical protein